MKNLIQRFIREEDGQDIIEYALLAAFISVCAVAVVTLIGPDVSYRYQQVADSVAT